MSHSQVDVMTLSCKRVDAELAAPLGPAFEVPAISGRSVLGMANQPASGKAEERVIGAGPRQPIEGTRPNRQRGSRSGGVLDGGQRHGFTLVPRCDVDGIPS